MRRAALAAVAGAAGVLAFAPVGFAPAGLAALVLLVHLWTGAPNARAAFGIGFVFGLAYFGAGVSWVYVSLARFGGMAPPLAALATAAFCAWLALFPALVGALQARLRLAAPWRATLVIPALWTLLEALRGRLFTGFPWLTLGEATLDTPLAAYAPLGGGALAGFAALVCAGLAWCVLRGPRRVVPLAVLLALLGAGVALRGAVWTAPAGPPFAVALLQGNVPQDLKFDPARYARTLETYARLAEQAPARLIVLPETALPRFLDQVDPRDLARIETAARRGAGDALLGVPLRSDAATYTNSVVSLGVSARQRYDKSRLVPFGEFAPPGFAWVMRALSIPLSDFSAGAPTQPPLALGGERIAVSVCYEDAYAGEVLRRLPEATLLVNVSNVAWFGDSLAPAQHLAIARLRALETGRMMLTATNTGVTAVIGADGALQARLPQFVEARLDAIAQGRRGATPYVRVGDALALGLALACLAAALVVARRYRSR